MDTADAKETWPNAVWGFIGMLLAGWVAYIALLLMGRPDWVFHFAGLAAVGTGVMTSWVLDRKSSHRYPKRLRVAMLTLNTLVVTTGLMFLLMGIADRVG